MYASGGITTQLDDQESTKVLSNSGQVQFKSSTGQSIFDLLKANKTDVNQLDLHNDSEL